MNLANKLFKNNKTGEVVKVIDSFENIAVLENKGKEDVRKLMDPSQYTEQIDPSSFFNNQSAYNHLAEKIKSIPTDHIKDEGGEVTVQVTGDGFRPAMTDSAIVMTSEEDEKAELARKYGVNPNTTQSIQKQNEVFAKLLGEEGAEELPKSPTVTDKQPTINSNSIQPPVQKIEANDPITAMFKNVKRGLEFKMALEIQNKIPRIDFIEMMEDSYEISIIDFLAEEFTNNLLSNPQKIKETIKDKIKQVVYGAEVTKKPTQVETKEIENKPDKIQIDPNKVIKSEPEMLTEGLTKKVKVKRATKKEQQ